MDLKKAIPILSSRGLITKDLSALGDLVASYEYSKQCDNAILGVWRTRSSFNNIKGSTRKQLEILSTWGLRDFLDENWDDRFKNLVGVMTKNDMLDNFDMGSGIPGKVSKSFIVSPLFSVPGMPSGLAGFTTTGSEKISFCSSRKGMPADGLMMLDTLPSLFEKRIYAFSDLSLAFTLQVRNQFNRYDHLPIVGYTKDSERVWSHFPVSEVVFHMPHFNYETITAALKIQRRAYISTGPHYAPDLDPINVIGNRTSSEFLGAIAAHTKPLYEVLLDTFRAADYVEMERFVHAVPMSPEHWNGLTNLIDKEKDSSLYEKINRFQSSQGYELQIPYKDTGPLIERSDGLYFKDRCLCPAVVIPETTTRFGDRSILSGTIKCRGDVIPFSVPGSEFSGLWVEKFLESKGIVIRIDTSLRGNYGHIVLNAHPPEIIEGVEKVGWDNDKRGFIFKNCSIGPTGVPEVTRIPVLSEHPTEAIKCDMQVGTVMEKKAKANTSGSVPTLYAIAISIAASVIGYADGYVPFDIILHCEDRSQRRMVFDHVVNEFYLRQATEKNLDDMVNADNYPAAFWMDSTSGSVAKLAKHAGSGMVIAADSPAVLSILSARDSVLIDVSGLTDLSGIDDLSALVPIILSWYQKADRKMNYGKQVPSPENHITRGVYRLVCDTIAELSPTSSLDTVEAAIDEILVNPNFGNNHMGRRFLAHVFYLIAKEKFRIEDSERASGDNRSSVITSQETVRIPYSSGIRRSAKQLSIDISEAVKAFEDDDALVEVEEDLGDPLGLTISYSYWSQEIKKWIGASEKG